ncbi:molecular chaperone HtpG [Putridiphycobacter roseus]|uniref:Chaperone protein HtpG n=1 Tax=Putridiphycobacter roseus TaxID=2219161 RepID=A0A2W1NNQ3_9FLAO|nr:molecular chaperone HtpG [Putridiphycobacter roseus]PZE17272.1 molecular chaperone HtpG [Putridiphycobacter roseus]
MATKGTINVQTENIFPLIKRFLYSDHEIFLRELVSNAVDSTSKLKVLSVAGEVKGDLGDTRIEISIDKAAKTLTVKDRGIGLTEDDLEKYINQIAFSGAEEFVKKYEGKEGAEQIIGHFGLGFYSAFMVAEKVQIKTLSYKEGAQAVMWESDGTPEYTITPIDKKDRGAEIVMHIAEDSLEFLEEARISTLLNKYCKFLPVEIVFGEKTEKIDDPKGEKDEEGKVKQIEVTEPNVINNTKPLWVKAPADLTEEDYKAFYRELYPASFDEPLFHIHLNVDYPFHLTGVLYFPKIQENVEIQKNKIQLYSNQVFITDSVEQIVPEFLTLLHGVIDSPDIPLNVSRSYLQSDGNVKKIASHITKKVADKLQSMFNEDRKDFEAKWDDLKVFVEYGTLTDDKFAEKAAKFTLLKNTNGEYFTVEEYKEKIAAAQTDKDGKLVVLYANSKDAQHQFISNATERGYDVLLFDSPLTPHFIAKLESTLENVSFSRVDSDTLDKLIQKDVELPSKLSDEEKEKLKPLFEEVVNKEKFTVQFENMSETEAPVIITQPEFMRRMQEQQRMGGGGMFGAFPEMFNFTVNANHPAITALLSKKGANKKKVAKQLADLAMLSQGMLKGEALSKFINRSVELID